MKQIFSFRHIIAVLLIAAVFAGVYGCTGGSEVSVTASESLREYTSVDTYIVTEENGDTVTATDDEGSAVPVTETVVLTLTEKVTVTNAVSDTKQTTQSAAASSKQSTTKITAGTTAKPAATTAKKPAGTTSAAKTTAKSTTAVAAKPTTTTKPAVKVTTTSKVTTTTKPTTTKPTTTVPTTKYVPVSELSPKFSYLNTTDKVAKFVASNKLADFGMSAAVQAAFKKDPSNWRSFTIAVNFINTTGSNITIYGLKTDANGKDGVYVGVSGECEYGFSAADKSEHTVYYHVLVSDSKLEEPNIISTIKGMGALLSYSRTPADGNDIPNRQYSEIK